MTPIQLGQKVRDRITGFTGIVVSRHEYLHGCTRLSVQPEKMQDGKPVETSAFDEPQLEVLGRKIMFPKVPVVKPGGPQKEPPQRPIPSR